MGPAQSKPPAPPPPPAAPAAAGGAAPPSVSGKRANRVMVTRDGRHLSFAEAGDPAGFPVLCFFGVGGSRYLVLLFDAAARRLGLRVVAVDRPGFGCSSLAAGGGFAAFAVDVEALCATLGLRRVAIWGHSVGCAYAAACALHEPLRRRRLAARLALVSPWVPLDSPGVPLHFRAARFFPDSLAALAAPGAVDERRKALRRGRAADEALSAPSAALDALGLGGGAEFNLCGAPEAEEEEEPASRAELSATELRALEALPLARRVLLASVIEAQRQGPRGFRDEFKLCCGDFGFRYSDVRWPARLYHGSADNLVEGASARWLRDQLRRGLDDATAVELVEERGGTHNGMVFATLRRSLAAVARDVAAGAPV